MELRAQNPVEEFIDTVHKVYGLFLDGDSAFPNFSMTIEKGQKQTKTGLSITELDKIDLFYGKGDPNSTDCLLFHHDTQGEVKKRNQKNGDNTGILGNFCLVMIFHYWDEKYREQIAQKMGLVKKEDLKIDIMGDIRFYRIAIIHNKGIATKDCEKTKITKFFKQGEEILLNGEKMETLITKIVDAMKQLKMKTGESFLTRNLFTNKRTHPSIFDI